MRERCEIHRKLRYTDNAWLLLRSCHINTSSFCFFLFSASCQDMIFRQTVAFTQTSLFSLLNG